LSLEELAMPDLDLIKQEEQGVRVRHGRFARGTMKKIPRMVPMAEIMKKLANMKKLMVAIRSGANLALGYPTLPSSCPLSRLSGN